MSSSVRPGHSLVGRTAWTSAAVLIATTCTSGDGNRQEVAPIEEAVAMRIRELAVGAPIIIVGRVTSIAPGRTAGPAGDRLQFEDVRIEVEQLVKGDDVRSTVLVEQVASEGRTIFNFEPYGTGGRFLLCLRPSQTEPDRLVALPGGRFRLVEGRAESLHPEPIVEDGEWAEGEILELIHSAVGE